MKTVESAPTIPFRSKKASLQATPKKPAKLWQEERPELLETPEKPSQPPRVRNQNMALSIRDVKRTAKMLRNPEAKRSDLSSDLLGNSRSGTDSRVRDLESGKRGAMKNAERSVKLPEKYSMLCEFFNGMVSVIPLLRMRKMSPTLTNISPKIQSLTDRRFTINHLAQLKFILPEAIVAKRILVRDERTECMKEELLITLDKEVVKGSMNVKDIRDLFRSRIEEYHKSHSEEEDVPEGELPALFCQPNQKDSTTIDKTPSVSATSHYPKLFQRSFSRQADEVDSEKPENPTTESIPESSLPSNVLSTPIKPRSTDTQATPSKEALTPVRLMASTPAKQPLKRCYMTPDNKVSEVPTKLARRPTRTRSLKFDHPEDNASADDDDDDDDSGPNTSNSAIDFLPKNLLQSVKENERKIMEEQDPAISLARRRHQLMSGLPKLFDLIHLMFHSISKSVMTKEQLLHKIIASHTQIIDRGEVEEQLELLQELAPEYISERTCSSGDTLVRLNKTASAEAVRAKLSEGLN